MTKPFITFSLLCLLSSCSGSSMKETDSRISDEITTDTIADKVAEVTVIQLKPSVFNHEIVSNGRLTDRKSVV